MADAATPAATASVGAAEEEQAEQRRAEEQAWKDEAKTPKGWEIDVDGKLVSTALRRNAREDSANMLITERPPTNKRAIHAFDCEALSGSPGTRTKIASEANAKNDMAWYRIPEIMAAYIGFSCRPFAMRRRAK